VNYTMIDLYTLLECEGFDHLFSNTFYISTMACSAMLSLIGSSFMLVCFFTFGKTSSIGRFVFCVSINDYALSLTMLGIFIRRSLLLYEDSIFACILENSIWQFIGQAMICWNLCISIYVSSLLFGIGANYRDKISMWIFFGVISWGYSMVGTIVKLSIPNNYYQKADGCVIHEPWHTYLWSLPNAVISAIVFMNFLILFCKTQQPEFTYRVSNITATSKTLFKFLFVFLVSWTFTCIISLFSKIEYCAPFLLHLVAVNLSQVGGLLNAIVYAINNKNVQSYYQKKSFIHICMVVLLGPLVLWTVVFPKYISGKCKQYTKKKIDAERERLLQTNL